MGATGGQITNITFNHPTLGSGTFFPKSDESSTYQLGGPKSEDDDSLIDGGEGMIDIMQNKRPGFQAVIAWDANIQETLEKVNAMAASPVLGNWTITSVNGTVYALKGKPVGPVDGSGNEATVQLKVAGGGRMKKIVG